MAIEIASVEITTEINLSGFNAGIKSIEKTKIDPIVVGIEFDVSDVEAQRKQLEKIFSRGLDLKIRVDDSELYDLNKHLDLKDDHVERLQRKWDRNPLTVRVDTSEIDEALEKAEQLTKSKTSGGNKSSSKSSKSSFEGVDISVALEEGFAKATDSLKQIANVITKPIQSALTGLFEGIGMSISERLTGGVMDALMKKGVLNFDAITNSISDFLVSSTGKISKEFKKEGKQVAKVAAPTVLPDLSNLKNLQREAERVVVDIPQAAPKQAAKQVQVAAQELGRVLGNQILDSLEEEFSLLNQALKKNKPDIGRAEAQFAKIRQGFSGAYANLNKALADGNIDLARSYQRTIQDMAKMARQEIDKIQTELKAEGASNKFGARLPTIAGSTKGHVTQYENKATRKTLEINKQTENFANQSAQVGIDVTKGVAKGLSSIKGVERQSSMIAFTILNTLKDDLEIRSPSKKGIQIGIDFVRGIGVGIGNTSGKVISQGKQLSKSLQSSLTPSKTKQQKPKSQEAVAEQSAVAAMDNFYNQFGQRFKANVFKGMPDDVANEMAGEVAGMIFSGFSMAFPQAIAGIGLGPMLIAALPTVITGLGLNKLLSPVIARAVEGIKIVEPIRQRFDVLGGNEAAGKAEFDYANKVAERYSVSKESSLGQYSQMAIAARGTKLEGEGVKELFEGISASTRALRLSTADTNLVFMAYTQMLAKGKISMEELRQQLGERFPPAMGVFAKAMGVTVGEMGTMIESGNALSEDVLPKVGAVLKQDFGKAASGAGGGLLTAFTAIENAGFDLSVKLSETFSGIFGAVVNLGAGIFNIFNQNFDLILKLGGAFVIGITAQIAVGLQQIMMMPGISTAMASMQGVFISTFAKSITLLAPFMFGMFIDVADDFLGAQNSIFDNMSKGVTNAILSIVTFVDDASRNITGSAFFKPDHDNAFIGFFIDIADKIKGVFQILPPGLVEMGALMIMFEQVSVLGKMFLGPTFLNLRNALGGMAVAMKNAFTNGQNLKSMFRMMIADSAMAKGAMIALNIAMKGFLAFGMLAFAQGDFADELAKSFSKAETSIVNSIKSIGSELDKLKPITQNVGEGLGALELKSKGVELNPLKIIGASEDSFKWDDMLKKINESDRFKDLRGLNKDFKTRADKLGVGDVFTGQEVYITRAQQQVLNKADDLQRMNKELETRLGKLNLTPSTVQNFISGDISKAVKEVQAIDKQLKTLGGKRSDLALVNDTASKAAVKGIDKEIDALMKKRKEKASPLTSALSNVDEIKKQLDDVGKAIEADDTLPLKVKQAYKKLLEPQTKMVDDTVKHLKDAGLYDAIKPLENVWQRVTESLSDAEQQFEKTRTAGDTAFKEAQTLIYAQNTDKATLDTALENAELQYMQQTQQQVSAILAKREAALKELLSISGVETNKNRKEEVDKLREEITKGKEELTGLNLEISKAQSERQLRFQELSNKIDEYYKGVANQAIETEMQLSKQMSDLDNQQFANEINRAMLGAGDNIISQFVGSLLEAVNQIAQAADSGFDAQSQIMQAQKSFDDTIKSGEDLRKQLPTLSVSGDLPTIPVEIDLNSVAANSDVKQLNAEIGKGVSATQDLNQATESFNTTVADSGNLIAYNTDATQGLEQSVTNVAGAMDNTVMSTDSLNTAVSSTTDSASYLQNQIDTNTVSTEQTNTAMQGVGTSIDANTQKTVATTEQTSLWHQWLSEKGISGAMTGILASITGIGAAIMDNIKKTIDWFKTFANNIPILNQVGKTMAGWGNNLNQAVGGAIEQGKEMLGMGTAGGAFASGLFTGPSHTIGGSADYHIDSKISKSIGKDMAIQLIDQMAAAYNAQGREMMFSNSGVAGKTWKTGASKEEKYALLEQIDAAHSHSPNPSLWDFDYYVPKKGEDMHGKSTEGAEFLLPNVAGGKVEYASGGGYGNYAVITDAKGNLVMKTGHGDNRRALPGSRTLSASPPAATGSSGLGSGVEGTAKNLLASMGGGNKEQAGPALPSGPGRIPKGGTISSAERVKADPQGAAALIGVAKRLGLKPEEFVALMSWESGGTLNPNVFGGDGNEYKGLIQFSPENQAKYGTSGQQSIAQQATAVEQYLKDRGFKPGQMDIRHAYSAVLAGNASERYWDLRDSNGTNVRNAAPKFQQGDHFNRAVEFLKASGVNPGSVMAGAGSMPTAQAPAFQPTAIPKVWTPDSVATSGNASIAQAQDKAAQQRDAQKAAAARQALVQAETGTIQGLQKGYQSLVQVEKQLRQSGYETRDIFEDIGKMNLESLGPLSLPEQRQQRLQELTRQYRDSRQKVDEKILDVQNRQTSAQAILDQPGGVLTPAVREKFNKLLSMPIAEDLKTRLQEAMTSGVFGDQLRTVLQKSVAQGNQEITTLKKASAALESGEKGALKAAQERFDFEEKARANAVKFEQESLSIATLQARLDQLKGKAEREPFGDAKAQIPAMEALIALRQNTLDYDKQIEELEKRKRDKSINQAEADNQIKELKNKRAITEQTIKENQAYQQIVNTREKENRDREIGLQAAKDDLAVQKQRLETLKALPQNDPNRSQIPFLEYQIELQELQLKLGEDLAAVRESVFKDPSSKEAGDARIKKLREEYAIAEKNLGTRLKQQTVEQELAQQRAILGIREQELGFAEQLLEAQSRSIELGRSNGDTLADRYNLQTKQQQLGLEKQILDVKELALQSGKSAEEVAAIESQLRKINDIKLDNIAGEMQKAFSDRKFAVQQRLGESGNSVLSARQSLMSTYGFSQEANRLGKEIAVNQQTMDYSSQKRDLDEFIKTNAVAADKAALLRDNLASVNDIKFREIEAQFNPLKGVIDSSVGALKGAFKSLIKDGKVDFDSFFDGILDSIAEFLSNMLVEQLMGFLSPKKDKTKGGGMFPDATADPAPKEGDFTSLLGLGDNPIGDLGKSPVSPMYVNVVNGGDNLGFAKPANNIVPFNRPGGGGGLFGGLFGGEPDYLSATTSAFGDLGGIFGPSFSGVTEMNPLPVGLQEAQPNIFSGIFGGGSGGGLGGILGNVVGAVGGGGGFGGIISSLLPLVGSLFGGLFAKGGVIGSGKSKKDDQLILAQRGEAVLTHTGVRAIGGASAINALNRGYKVPRFAKGGAVGGEYGGTGSADAVERGRADREASRNEPIKLETTVINNVEYATTTQVKLAMDQARNQGARDGAKYISNKMENSPTWRNRHGIR